MKYTFVVTVIAENDFFFAAIKDTETYFRNEEQCKANRQQYKFVI